MIRGSIPRPARTRGFTLIEVLVAVAVLAVTLSAFIVAGARYADNARYLRDHTLALWVARNQMVEYYLAKNWPDTGTDEGTTTMAGRKWQWRAEINESPDPAVRRIDISVYRVNPTTGEPAEDAIATLSGFITQDSS